MSEGHFECKVSGKRESGSGIFLTLQIQPDDYTPDLATLRVGSALILGWAEVVNTAVEPIDVRFPEGVTPQSTPFLEKITKEKAKFSELPLSQQAAIRCQDNDFKFFLNASNAEAAAEKVRQLCGVASRSDLRPNTDAGHKWEAIEAGYQTYLTDRQYAEARR